MRKYRIIFGLLFLFLLAYVWLFSSNLPIGDQWGMIEMIAQPTWGNLWHPVNEHRTLIPNLASVAAARASGWDIRVDNSVSLVLFALIFWLIFTSFCDQVSNDRLCWLFFLAVLTQFNPLNHEIILWAGGGMLWCVLFVVLALHNLEHFSFLLVFLCCASFSFLSGLLAWPAAGLILVREKKLDKVVVLSVAAISCGWLYFSGWSGQVTSIVQFDWLRSIKYFLIYLGGNFVPTYRVGSLLPLLLALTGAVGVFILCLIGSLVARSWQMANSVTRIPYAMIIFGLLTAIASAVGRAHFGLESALISRYHIFQMFISLGIFWLWLLAVGDKYYVLTRNVLIGLIVLGLVSGVGAGIIKKQRYQPVIDELRSKGENISREKVNLIYHDYDGIKAKIVRMKELKLNVFKTN